jgi:5-methylcytosine-specific restriction endonuclease McrA
MQKVFVLDKNKQPLMPCHPARARELLKKGKAAVFRRYPFTIILKDREGGVVQPLQTKIDPGSKTTGIALVGDFTRGKQVIWGAEIHHRGEMVKKALKDRRAIRRSRRNRKTRYRKSRFKNRKRSEGWLPPSLMSRVENILTWVRRIRRFAPITGLSLELVRFDTQKLQNPEISGIQYQRGELWGYEVKEYLLEKWGRRCVYCGKEGVPLEIDHVVPKSRGGTDRVSNLTIACHKCNQKKGNQPVEEFLVYDPERLKDIKAGLKKPLKDAAAVNTVRWHLFNRLQKEGLPLETGTGGRTKYNRQTQNYPKKHWIDAACVGQSGQDIRLEPNAQVLEITATGYGTRRMCNVDKYGFPQNHRQKERTFLGFKTGDIALAVIPKGKYAGIHAGRIAVRHRPSFRLNGFDVHPKYLKLLQKNDGYGYQIFNRKEKCRIPLAAKATSPLR